MGNNTMLKLAFLVHNKQLNIDLNYLGRPQLNTIEMPLSSKELSQLLFCSFLRNELANKQDLIHC